jgi:hypothetical protein
MAKDGAVKLCSPKFLAFWALAFSAFIIIITLASFSGGPLGEEYRESNSGRYMCVNREIEHVLAAAVRAKVVP